MQHYNALEDRENLLKYADLALAYMINDQPVLELSSESQKYLDEFKI